MKKTSILAMAMLGLALGVAVWSARGAATSASRTAAFPDHPITIIVTFPPGGGTDLLARKLGAALSDDIGQAVVVENRPGASGNIGARTVAQSAPDGYTLLMVNSSFAITPGVFSKLDFSPEQDFAAVINVAFVPSVIVTRADSGIAGLPAVLERDPSARALLYASCGNGTPQHLAGEMLRLRSAAPLQQVPYKGCGPALTDVLSGHVPLGIVTASSAVPFIESGRLRALAVTSAERSLLLPQVPTVAEYGMAGYELNQWHGLLAPAGTPPEVIAKLNAAVAAIMARPAMRNNLLDLGFAPTASSAAEFDRLVHADIARFTALTRELGLRVD
ncbi:tripartite tricarboxylate transporter substrate binding protein [Pseudomonadota bacterium AL_CKDN230030165-1A_HGKHYDSX7]